MRCGEFAGQEIAALIRESNGYIATAVEGDELRDMRLVLGGAVHGSTHSSRRNRLPSLS